MRPIALDTNADVAFKRGEDAAVEVLRCADHLLLSVTVLGEWLAGLSCGTQAARNREELSRFLASPRVELDRRLLSGARCAAVQLRSAL